MNRQVLAPCEEENSTPSLTGALFRLFPKLGIPSLLCEVCLDPTADFSQKVACLLSRWCVELHGGGVVYLIHFLQRWEILREGSGPATELRTERRRDRYPYHWRVRRVVAVLPRLPAVSTRSLCLEKKSAPSIGLLTAAWTNGTSAKWRPPKVTDL